MQTGDKCALSRRAFVGKVSKGAAGTVLALSITPLGASATQHFEASKRGEGIDAGATPEDVQVGAVSSTNAESTVAAPWELLRPLTVGATVTRGWRLSGLTGVVDGSCVATLENDKGRSQRLHLCRNDGSPQGLVYTDRVDLVVMNGGRGDLPTEENFGQAVAEIAHVIAGNEAKHDELMRTLLPQSEREQKFAATARLR